MKARKINYAREAITHSIIIQEERIKKITNELKEKVDNKIPVTTISSISYGIARSANKNLYKCYKVANICNKH